MTSLEELETLKDRILNFSQGEKYSKSNFDNLCLDVFRFQFNNNKVYSDYLFHLSIGIEEVRKVEEIPFMPISFFKNHLVKSGTWPAEKTFQSSGTTGQVRSRHEVQDLSFYETISKLGFEQVYGTLEDLVVIAFLPSYIENKDSSLIFMVDKFIEKSTSEYSGYYINDDLELLKVLEELKKGKAKVFVLGVTFALLDFVEKNEIDLSQFVVMETGGMKGRRKELLRTEVHSILKKKLNLKKVHSEYGMAELLSQAYSKGDGVFSSPSWMKIRVREVGDPFSYVSNGRVGGVNVIDLANVHSCSFIETQDLGKIINEKGDFEILGRFDDSEIRGCNLLYV